MIEVVKCMILTVIVLSGSALAQEREAAPQQEIEAVLQQQVAAWNEGDIPGFMSAYWKSSALTFSSGGQTTRGWQETLTRYQNRYDSAEKMGHLTFSELDVHPLGHDHALVLGRWRLQRTDEMEGNFTLVLKRDQQRWMIIHDHTSLHEPKSEE